MRERTLKLTVHSARTGNGDRSWANVEIVTLDDDGHEIGCVVFGEALPGLELKHGEAGMLAEGARLLARAARRKHVVKAVGGQA